MVNKILFANPEFEEGITNLTVRRGTKWSGISGKIDIADINGNVVAEGKVVCTKTILFKDIIKEDISLEHDSKCRDYEGLLEVMKEVYDDFDVYEVVTLVYFELYT